MSNVIVYDRIQLRQGTAADLASVNEVLLVGEPCVETDTGKYKIGDGSTAWNSLPYQGIWTLADIRRALDLLGSTAEGDIIYKGASGWTVLPKGSDGQFLKVVSGVPVWASSSGGGGAWNLLDEKTVTGSAATTLSFTDLDLSASQRFELEIFAKNATGSASIVSMYYNADTTATNYYRQTVDTNGTVAGLARINDAVIAVIDASSEIAGQFSIFQSSGGYPLTMGRSTRRGPSSISRYDLTHVRNNTDNVTRIDLTASVANSLAIGTTARLYAVG